MKFIKTLFCAVVVFLALSQESKADVILTGMGGELGLGVQALPLVDDGSSNELNLPFNVNFFNNSYNTFFVNSNGNLTFGNGYRDYTPESFATVSAPMIAPYWGDVDVSCGSEENPSCGNIYVGSPEEGVTAVTWYDVAEFGNSGSGERNTFQAVLIDRSGDTGVDGDFDIEFRYQQLEWADSAQAGFAAGNGFNGGGPGDGCEIDCECPGGDCECPNGDCECPIEECGPVNFPQSIPTPQVAELASSELAVEDIESVNYYSLPGALTQDVVELANTSNTGQDGIWTFSFRDGTFLEPGQTPSNPIMPISEGENGWGFDFDVDFGEIVFIDPDVAVGYDYFVDNGSSFASVILPSGFNANYELWLLVNGVWEFSAFLNADEQYFFGGTGVTEFRILGIDISNMVDPTDSNAFVTGLTFTGSGNQQIRQVPITEFVADATDVSEPSPLLLLLLGCGFLALQRKKKVKAA